MKAKIEELYLTLTPECPEEYETLRKFSARLSRTHVINCQGFKYLEKDVSFVIQGYPSRD